MFCDEAIVRVYLGGEEYKTIDGADAFLDCYHDLAYHVTEGYRIVLCTENWAITIDVNGVSKEPVESLRERAGEWLRDGIEIIDPEEPPFVSHESMLFVGERLKSVTKDSSNYLLEFDDFALRVFPYQLGTMDKSLNNKNHWSYNYVLGCDRHLKRQCDCGGQGEILMDFVSDYIVRCKNCKRSTWANMDIKLAIEDWNDGELHCVVDDITIE